MARIGIFIDGLQGSISSSFRKKIGALVQDLPETVFCSEDNDLNSSSGMQNMARRLEADPVDRILIIGGSPKVYEASFQKLATHLPLNPYLFAVANVKESALWATADEEKTLESARKIILKAIRMVSLAGPIETQSRELKPEVLVVGGGISGISVALSLARSGIHVVLLERARTLGGKALELRRFYSRPEEVRAWMDEKISELEHHSRITLLTQAGLKGLGGHLGQFRATIQKGDGTETDLFPSAIIIATGYVTDRERKGIYGHKRIISLADMEKLIEETSRPPLMWSGEKVETITFLLDEVNSDIKIDSINAVKQGLRLQKTLDVQVAILCQDVKVSADGMEHLYREARGNGVLFFRYDDPLKLSIVNQQIQIDTKDTAAVRKEDGWPVSILSDLVVISEAFRPDPETEQLSRILNLHLGDRGFLLDDNPQFLRGRSNRKGIFVAGGCRFPQEISETLFEAAAVAQEVIALVAKGTYSYDLSIAEIDPQKCAVCYTCPRLCPHSAITVEKYAEKNVYVTLPAGDSLRWGAARVDPAACFGCGICVGECPAKAIKLNHLTDEQIYVQMGLSG